MPLLSITLGCRVTVHMIWHLGDLLWMILGEIHIRFFSQNPLTASPLPLPPGGGLFSIIVISSWRKLVSVMPSLCSLGRLSSSRSANRLPLGSRRGLGANRHHLVGLGARRVVVSSSSSSPSPPSQNGIDAEEENGKKKKKKLQRHVKGVRPQYKNLEGPGGALQSFDATLPVEVDISRKALYKAARKAVEDYEYEQILQELQIELVFFQEWVKEAGLKVAVIFEGRDAAGKGGCIARITDAMSPRVCKVVALAAPSPAEKTQWYFQRYIKHLPSAGEVVLFDRSWYNRAGVERVMGFCTDEELDEFYRTVPQLEEMITNSGTILIKLWFDVSDQEQEKRFQKRLNRSMSTSNHICRG